MIPLIVFDITQIQKAEFEAPSLILTGELAQPICDDHVLLLQLRCVAITGLTNFKYEAGLAH